MKKNLKKNLSLKSKPEAKIGPIKNPFSSEETLKAWFDSDPDYNLSKRQQFNKYLSSKHLKNSFSMSLQNRFLNSVNFFTKHAVLAGLIVAVTLGGIGASAAEIFAPEEFKPSNIINQNRNKNEQNQTQNQPENDNSKPEPLKADENNQILIIEECDLAIKFNKKYSFENLSVTEGSSKIYNYGFSLDSASNTYQAIIGCDLGQKFEDYEQVIFSNQNNDGDKRKVKLKPVLLSEASFEKVNKDKIIEQIFSTGEMGQQDPRTRFIFEANENKVYDFSYDRESVNQAEDFLIQFNSLAPSTTSTETNSQTKTESSSSKKSINKVQLSINNENFKYELASRNPDIKLSYVVVSKDNQYYFFNLNGDDPLWEKVLSFNSNNLQVNISGVVETADEKTPDGGITYNYKFLSVSKFEPIASNSAAATTYTNPFYSNLKINYNNSWKIENTTSPYDIYPNLLQRNIQLSKGQTLINFTFQPVRIPSGCSGSDQDKILGQINGFNKYKYDIAAIYNNTFEYTQGPAGCALANIIETNIPIKDVKFSDSYFKQAFDQYYKTENKKTVQYVVSIYISSDNPQELLEAEDIIRKSVLK